MCLFKLLLTPFLLLGPQPSPMPQPTRTRVQLGSPTFAPGLSLPESKHLVHAVSLDVEVDTRGEGRGKIAFITTPPNYDEYGDLVTGRETDLIDRSRKNQQPPVVLECTLEYEKAGHVGRVNEAPVRRSVFRVKGPKITSALSIATAGPGLTSGRLLVHGKDQRVECIVELRDLKPRKESLDRPPVPCHPGCFPTGTLVHTPGGTQRIEILRVGDMVTTISPEGRAMRGVIQDVFTVRNRLFEVRTDRGSLVTTDAQPLCLTAGGFRRSGDLKAGDKIWQWQMGTRVEAVVREVVATGKEGPVFNLILGDSAIFVAGDFLARGKPPAEPVKAKD